MKVELTQEQERIVREIARQKGIRPEDAARLMLERAFAQEGVAHELASAPIESGAALVEYWKREGLIGTRPDIKDSAVHARRLRQQAGRRESA